MAQKIKIEAEFLASITGMNDVVRKMQQGLDGINPSKATNFSKMFTKISDEYKNFLSLTKDGYADLLDSKAVIKSGESIIKMFRRIQEEYGDIASKSDTEIKKLFPSEFNENVEKGIDAIDKLIKKEEQASAVRLDFQAAQKNLTELQQKAEGARESLKRISSGKYTTVDELDAALQKTTQELTNTRDAAEKAGNELKNAMSGIRADAAVAKIGDIQKAIQKAGEAWDKYKTAKDTAEAKSNGKTIEELESYKQKLKELSETLKGITGRGSTEKKRKILEDAGVNIEPDKLKSEIKRVTSAIEASKAAEEARKEAFATGINQDQIETLSKLSDTYNKATDAQKKASAASKEVKDIAKSGESAIKTLRDLGATEEEVDRLQNELKGLGATDEDIQKVATTLQQLGLISKDSTIKTVEDLKELKQTLQNQDSSKIDEIKKHLIDMGVNANEAGKLVDNLRANMEKFGDSADDAKRVNNEIEQLKSNITYFFGISNTINIFKDAIRQAFNTVKELDKAMTETAVVTDFSVGDMWKQLPEYTKRANALGVATKEAYAAATLYYQQGLKTNEVIAVSNETLKMARIAGIEAAEATDYMTAALRGFNMEVNEASATRVNDVYSELAAITASDTQEISVAMTKTASLAHNANMEFETTAAFLSQIIETTRESAETAGTALKISA